MPVAELMDEADGTVPYSNEVKYLDGSVCVVDHLKGIYRHNVLEMTRLGDLLPRLYREVAEGKKS